MFKFVTNSLKTFLGIILPSMKFSDLKNVLGKGRIDLHPIQTAIFFSDISTSCQHNTNFIISKPLAALGT